MSKRSCFKVSVTRLRPFEVPSWRQSPPFAFWTGDPLSSWTGAAPEAVTRGLGCQSPILETLVTAAL